MNPSEAQSMAKWIADSCKDDHAHYLQRFEAPSASSCFDKRFTFENLPEGLRKTADSVLYELKEAMLPILPNIKIRSEK